ncbi:actin depolymerizing protein [Basidiobolus meristosporus CBS 931.73]|uniref:Actin depolymerizing protein n=1 Tax=Basidiobolus meristosporus CBS 931.73 TaxID=1314790 RepID=A0A1Y1Z5U9_9FUNG|nr:actin depolymerizing protein [Basidiobolus meristosporus CBS 931.73]|eukprot:ORY05672.1 actin depolymerizing protein [Basidiobolus meristosporus CBS 931.73]
MPSNKGLIPSKEYDIKDSNVELIGTDIDHKVKYNSALTEPAWNDGCVGVTTGLKVWRIENFEVVPLPPHQIGVFFEGDSYIVLHSYKVGNEDGTETHRLGHDAFFWLGSKTSQDEAGVAAYKTVELDEFLQGTATQHRETQAEPSDVFLALFPRITIRRGGVASGFRHVEETVKPETKTLLRVFSAGHMVGRDSVVVHEVEPSATSLDEGDVFIFDRGDKIYVWQGKNCSPMEKAKAAQIVHDMTLAKHVDVEVLSQLDSGSRRVLEELGAGDESEVQSFHHARPLGSTSRGPASGPMKSSQPSKLLRLSDASGQLQFELIKDGYISKNDLDGNDVFILNNANREIWVWEGARASSAERASWLKVAQAYVRHLQSEDEASRAYQIPIAKVKQGFESPAFLHTIRA